MTLSVRCADLGLACSDTVRAGSRDELADRVAAHALDDHGVELTATLLDYALAEAREGST